MSEQQSPFVCAYALDGRGGGREIEPNEVDACLDRQELVWIHLDLNWSSSRTWLASREDVSELVVHALLENETRPRAAVSDKGVLLVLRGVNMNPGADPDDMVAIRLWLDSKWIISSRRRKLLSIVDIRNEIATGEGPRSPGEFIVSLIGHLAERIGNVVDKIEDAVEAAEQSATSVSSEKLRAQVSLVRRRTAAIRRYLAPQREALDRLYRHPGPLFTSGETEELREQADRITRYVEDLELVRERSMFLQEELMNRIAHEQNSRVYLLSVVAAIFLPLTFVTGLLGMNVAGLPGTTSPFAFALAVVIMLGLGVGLALFFKWKRWI